VIRDLIRLTPIVGLAAALCGAHASTVFAQGEALASAKRSTGPARPTPRSADGKVDLSGIWGPDAHFIYDINEALKPGETLPIQPWALKVTVERPSKDDPEALCLPTGEAGRVGLLPHRIGRLWSDGVTLTTGGEGRRKGEQQQRER